MKKYITIIVCAIGLPLLAQTERNQSLVTMEQKGWQYSLLAGVNIGGASPLPLPREIREIKGYSPKFNGSFEGRVTKWLSSYPRLGITAGLRLEEKGMETDARVKNYGMEIISEGNRVAGYWTGDVHTLYKSSFVTLPVQVSYRLSERWTGHLGLYLSYRLDGDFSGYVSEGYLREGTPIGERVSFAGSQTAAYQFGNELRHWLWGEQIGVQWQAFKHLSLHAQLTYGMNGIFKKDFKTITFKMYPIYMNIGFGYSF